MLGRIYTVAFISTILISLWYQRVYLEKSAVEFQDQLMAENAILPIITGMNYNSSSFKNGILNSSFTGEKIIYYSNKHFEANNKLVYSEFNKDVIIVETNKAIGELASAQSDNNHGFISKNKLKNVILPSRVDFNFNNNIGRTSEVTIDTVKKTLDTDRPIQSYGPAGSIKGIGFFYSINKGEFVIKSGVEGSVEPAQIQKIRE